MVMVQVHVLLHAGMLGMSDPWIAGARAKWTSLACTNSLDSLGLFARAASSRVCPADMAPSYKALTMDEGAASVWSALDNHYDASAVEGFSDEAYTEMLEDESRTPVFAKAIRARLAKSPERTLTILDIGTGPFAILSLLAAEAGARKVYAMEVNPEAARRARETITAAGWSDVIEVLEGFSTSLELPEKVDVVVSEIIGSIASEEGVQATIQDAHARFVKEPEAADSWLPCRVETWCVPASYALHAALAPPRYGWGQVGEPLRLQCNDTSLLALSTPQRLEDISFTDGAPAAAPTILSFPISEERLEHNEGVYHAALLERGLQQDAAAVHARRAARGLSGLAMWPRLLFPATDIADSADGADGADALVVDSRGPGSGGTSAAPGRSAWQTVLPLLHDRPLTVEPGDVVRTHVTVELPHDEDESIWYTVEFG